jgi:hypothetical protein
MLYGLLPLGLRPTGYLASVVAVRRFSDRCCATILAGMDRTVPFFMNEIKPDSIDKGKSVLIASSE